MVLTSWNICRCHNRWFCGSDKKKYCSTFVLYWPFVRHKEYTGLTYWPRKHEVIKTTSCVCFYKVCKSVHHHTVQINHQLDAAVSPVYYLTFIYSSACFGCPHAHYQELNNCSSRLWFYLRSMVIAVLLVVVGPVVNRYQLLSPGSEGKNRVCSCSCWAPDDGHKDARNMLSCK